MANAVWYENKYILRPSFADPLTANYKAALNGIDVWSDRVVSEVNRWCAAETDGNIVHILDGVPQFINVLLVNALYFNGQWTKEFKSEDVSRGIFKGVSRESHVDMMKKDDSLDYFRNKDFVCVGLPFGNGTFSAVFVMPNEGTSLTDFIDNGGIEQAFNAQWDHNVRGMVTLPRFKFEGNQINLDAAMRAMDMSTVLEERLENVFANEEKMQLDLCQKSVVEFNTKGAVASSVTWTGGYGDSYPSVYPVFGRPFLFFITEKQTGACLMAGKIVDL